MDYTFLKFKYCMTLYISVGFLLLVFSAFFVFLNHEKFGKTPNSEIKTQFSEHNNFYDGEFQNQSNTPSMTGDDSMVTVFWNFFFNKNENSEPKETLPSVKTDLKSIPLSENVLVWFGHSSYFLQIDGKRFLIDPVFSGAASPVSFTTNSYKGSEVYSVDDFPNIDYLLITHDHWDHLDYETLLKLRAKVSTVVTGMGVRIHLEMWGYNPETIIEKNWYETIPLTEGFSITLMPTRHFSGRLFSRNKSLWTSFVLKTPTKNLYLGGDSGYDKHFKETGQKYGPFDLAMLECGQYNKNWKYIHMAPEEVVQAGKDLQTKQLLPVHWGKFSLALHSWKEPIERLSVAAAKEKLPLITPLIGQKVSLDSTFQSTQWWKELQ